MNDEIKQILDDLKFISKEKSARLEFTQYGCKVLLDYITNLQEENERLKEITEINNDEEYIYAYEELQDKVLKLQKENKRLNNIIEKLGKRLDEDIELNYYKNGVRQYNKTLTEGGKLYRDYIKEYLEELKENK